MNFLQNAEAYNNSTGKLMLFYDIGVLKTEYSIVVLLYVCADAPTEPMGGILRLLNDFSIQKSP